MKNTKKLFGFAVITAILFNVAILLVGCDDENSDDSSNSGGDNDPKTLIVQNIPANIFAYGADGGGIGVFPAGTTLQQALSYTNIVAGAYLDNDDITITLSGSYYTITIPLYKIDTPERWTGSGTFDIYVALLGGGGHYYKSSSVNISSKTTIISFSSATEIQ